MSRRNYSYKPSTEMMDLIYARESKRVRKYRIICLKRSTFASKTKSCFTADWYGNSNLVYWMDNYAGYTSSYTLKEIEGAAGSHGDWLIEPVWVDEE